jgi:hypothetical protein
MAGMTFPPPVEIYLDPRGHIAKGKKPAHAIQNG